MNIKLIDDIEKLTGIKNSTLQKISQCIEYALIDHLIEYKYNYTDDIISFDIGIGVLSLEIIDDEIHYGFKPSKKFEANIVKAINDGDNLLETKLIESINKHIYKTYKDMF